MKKGIFTKITDYLQAVISPSNGSAEAKLFIALTAFGYVMLAGLVDLFTPYEPTEFIFYTIVGLIVACLGLGTYLNSRAITVKGDLASDIITEKPSDKTAEKAQDVMEMERPPN